MLSHAFNQLFVNCIRTQPTASPLLVSQLLLPLKKWFLHSSCSQTGLLRKFAKFRSTRHCFPSQIIESPADSTSSLKRQWFLAKGCLAHFKKMSIALEQSLAKEQCVTAVKYASVMDRRAMQIVTLLWHRVVSMMIVSFVAVRHFTTPTTRMVCLGCQLSKKGKCKLSKNSLSNRNIVKV